MGGVYVGGIVVRVVGIFIIVVVVSGRIGVNIGISFSSKVIFVFYFIIWIVSIIYVIMGVRYVYGSMRDRVVRLVFGR